MILSNVDVKRSESANSRVNVSALNSVDAGVGIGGSGKGGGSRGGGGKGGGCTAKVSRSNNIFGVQCSAELSTIAGGSQSSAGASSVPTQSSQSTKASKRPNTIAFQSPRPTKKPFTRVTVYINERTGFTMEKFGGPGGRIIRKTNQVKSYAAVTRDLGYKPPGLKWKGKACVTIR
ncbi:conserved hypothetical protein [Ricinus communis]|uniref:Uncharacterized protein n=1 Tax=Ricinus communis TaxID=3988 RepID=B9SQF4_RICCO|nr:conserved hypothetical protein [Ricinus communis]